MKKGFIHKKLNNKETILRTISILSILVIYGIYKNGYLLYCKKYISLISIFKPIYLIMISLGINAVVEFIFKRKIKWDFSYLHVVILSLFLMPNINIYLYALILFVGLIIVKGLESKVSINRIAFVKLLVVLGIILFSNYSYLNEAEENNLYVYTLYDILWGRNIGGICSTNIMLGLVIYSYLCIRTNYKKNIFPISYISYGIVMGLIMALKREFNLIDIFSSTVILELILVATETISSPYSMKGQYVYALFVGISGAILTSFYPYEGIFIATFVGAFLTPLWDKLAFIKKKVKK